jgi:hypothetical protein
VSYKKIFSVFLIIFLFLSSNRPVYVASPTVMPTFVPTFESIGIYWSQIGGSSSNNCRVQHREQGSSSWKESLPLWYDSRSHTVSGKSHPPEYRGSIVHLKPGTTYEIKLTLDSGTTVTQLVTTWSENFPQASVQNIGNRNSTLTISNSGSANGYLVYDGQGATIDVGKNHDHNIIINGSYVIIRNFVLKGAKRDAIEIGNNVHHVIIERNDISQWASSGDYSGDIRSAAIRTGDNDGYSSPNPGNKQFVIQRNRMYNPSTDSTYWNEVSHAHPAGPMGIALFNTGGNHVIRYNEIFSTNGNYYMDTLGGGNNSSNEGFPTSDTDIYANYISHAWDDGIQVEGGDMNVRVWGNLIDYTFVKVALAPAKVGPLYIWRNLSGVSQRNPSWGSGGVRFIKGEGGNGKVYVFNNTLLQPLINGTPRGSREGIIGGGIDNYVSRNNLFYCSGKCISVSSCGANDFDYDMCGNGSSCSETHGIFNKSPDFASYNPSNHNSLRVNGKGDFSLKSSSSGYDSGVVINNFYDNFTGNSPDIGAHEAGSPIIEFGVNAYTSSPPVTPIPTRFLSPTPVPSNTPIPSPQPPGSILEAEYAKIVNATIETEHLGFSGEGYVNFNPTESSITWENADTPLGSSTLVFRYALGKTPGRNVELKINGNVINSNLFFPPTLAWNDYQDLSVPFDFITSTNMISITTVGEDGPNIDYLIVKEGSIIPGDANDDGFVNVDDYVIWINNYGKSVSGYQNADFNNSGKVDGVDYIIWLTNFGG